MVMKREKRQVLMGRRSFEIESLICANPFLEASAANLSCWGRGITSRHLPAPIFFLSMLGLLGGSKGYPLACTESQHQISAPGPCVAFCVR